MKKKNSELKFSTVGYLINNLETLDEDEFEDHYNQLDLDEKIEVDEAIRNFANNAIGSEHWDSDD